MGAKVEWEPQQVKLTGNSLNGIDVDMNQMPDAAMTFGRRGSVLLPDLLLSATSTIGG